MGVARAQITVGYLPASKSGVGRKALTSRMQSVAQHAGRRPASVASTNAPAAKLSLATTTNHVASTSEILIERSDELEASTNIGATTELLNLGLVDQVTTLIGTLPLWKTVGEGEPLTLSIGVDVINLVSLQWYFNGQPIAGASRGTLFIPSVKSEQVGRYSLQARLVGITLASVPTDVQINATDAAVDRSAIAYDKFSDAMVALAAAKKAVRTKAGTASHGYTGTQIFSTVGSSRDPDEPIHCSIPGGASGWFAWQCPTNGTAVITTDASNFDTVLAVYVGPGTSYATLTNIACDNDSGPNGKTSRVTFPARAGVVYYLAVDGVSGAQGTVKLTFTVGTTPEIVVQPETRTAVPGKSAILTVSAQGFPAPGYQWSFKGNSLTGATNSTLRLDNFVSTQFGSYQVRVMNALGTVLSTTADLLPEKKTLRFASRGLQADGFHVVVECPSGTNYVLESSRDLLQWLPLCTNNPPGGVFTYVDTGAPTNRYLFYRVRALP